MLIISLTTVMQVKKGCKDTAFYRNHTVVVVRRT